MKSHTVPQRLLEQFAYADPVTNSLRLWRYEKGRPPYWKASPETSTTIDGHHADPTDPAKEEEIEKRLNGEFEDPIHQYLDRFDDPAFLASDLNRRRLTFYVTLLFTRSKARRLAAAHLQKVTRHAYESFLSNEVQVLTVAAKWSIDLLLSGRLKVGFVTRRYVEDGALRLLRESETERARQKNYVATVERAMATLDEVIYAGDWNLLRAPSESPPFVIGDAPVVTWERLDSGLFVYGMGFHRPNVEAFLPISPSSCLHLQPAVERTRAVKVPTVDEINAAQAAFASRSCFTNINDLRVDAILQPNFGKAKLGVTAFTVWHRDYTNVVYELLMNDGRWIERTFEGLLG
jgi:Protein of unknown function (DUF4238)